MAAGRKVIQCSLPLGYFKDAPAIGLGAIKAVFAEIVGTAPGSIAYNAGQIFGGTGYSEDDTLSKLYRDAAALRFLGVPNSEAYQRRGKALLANWTPDGEQLSQLPDERTIIEEITQRQALVDELATIRNLSEQLTKHINAWKFSDQDLHTAESQEAFIEGIGRQDALIFLSKCLLDFTHIVFEDCCNNESDIFLLRTWLKKVNAEFEAFNTLVATLHTPVAHATGSPGSGVITQYADFLKTELPYSSGDFLNKPTNPAQPRYVPEIVETDAYLSKRNQELIGLVEKQFGHPRNGMVYERYLEVQHRPDAADLDFLREQGFFRNPIPKELGGEQRSKADYYLLTVNTHRLADAAISLTIQVNSSLGTTPVLLAQTRICRRRSRAPPIRRSARNWNGGASHRICSVDGLPAVRFPRLRLRNHQRVRTRRASPHVPSCGRFR